MITAGRVVDVLRSRTAGVPDHHRNAARSDSDTTRSTERDTEPSGRRTRTRGTGASPADDHARARTSPAAVFALVFGLMALLAALTGLLAPVAVLFGLIGIVLGIVGMKAGTKRLVTGRGVAIGGLVLAVLGFLLGAAAIAGVASVVSSNPQVLDQITGLLDNARSQVPTP